MSRDLDVSSANIYTDGSYISSHPSLHGEDSEYKFYYIRQLLGRCNFSKSSLRVLDIGGGAGVVASLVCDYLSKQGFQIECHAFDLSDEMLKQQRSNNPYNNLATSDFSQICENCYDVALLIDVIEHVPDNDTMAAEINRISHHVIYNIPIELTLFDWLRNIYMKNRYYTSQTASLGHVHFYSYTSAKRFVQQHHGEIEWIFPNYSNHILESEYTDYVKQRYNRLRRVELRLSRFIYRYFQFLAPWVIQGSLFMLAKSRACRQ